MLLCKRAAFGLGSPRFQESLDVIRRGQSLRVVWPEHELVNRFEVPSTGPKWPTSRLYCLQSSTIQPMRHAQHLGLRQKGKQLDSDTSVHSYLDKNLYSRCLAFSKHRTERFCSGMTESKILMRGEVGQELDKN